MDLRHFRIAATFGSADIPRQAPRLRLRLEPRDLKRSRLVQLFKRLSRYALCAGNVAATAGYGSDLGRSPRPRSGARLTSGRGRSEDRLVDELHDIGARRPRRPGAIQIDMRQLAH